MANWFKLYETDLDETRMRYAMSQLPEVWPVWTGVLMECCKHRGDTFSWGLEDHELFGFSERLKISIPKVNEAINLLCSIHYIEKSNGTLKVLKWNEKQDDYLARKARGDYEKVRTSRRVSESIGGSPLEERRGEEKKQKSETSRVGGVESATNHRIGPEETYSRKLKTNPIGRGLDAIDDAKAKINPAFKRTGYWSHEEERMLSELISDRDEFEVELTQLLWFKESGKLPPQSVHALLESWTKYLDRSRNQPKPINPLTGKNENPNWYQDQEINRTISEADKIARETEEMIKKYESKP